MILCGPERRPCQHSDAGKELGARGLLSGAMQSRWCSEPQRRRMVSARLARQGQVLCADMQTQLSGAEGRLLSWPKDAGRAGGTHFRTPETRTKFFGLSMGDHKNFKGLASEKC